VVKAVVPPLQNYALIGHPARPRRARSQWARSGSGALGGSSANAHWWQSGAVAFAQLNEENQTSPHRASLSKGEKARKPERDCTFISDIIFGKRLPPTWRGNEGFDQHRYFFLLCFLFFLFWGKDCERLCAKMMVGEMEVKERPRPSPDYLMQLLNEKKLMTSLPNLCGIFTHLERLLDEGKLRVCKLEPRVCMWCFTTSTNYLSSAKETQLDGSVGVSVF